MDLQRAVQGIPESATITGMFLEPTAQEARRRGKPLPSARDRYVGFRFYPLREHVQLLVEACSAFYPGRPPRIALRKLGRAAPAALLNSTFGRVGIGSAQSPGDMLTAMAKSYPVAMPGSTFELLESGPKSLVVRLQGVRFFLDSHHVGVFEGVMRYAGVQGEIKVRVSGPGDADLLCTWR